MNSFIFMQKLESFTNIFENGLKFLFMREVFFFWFGWRFLDSWVIVGLTRKFGFDAIKTVLHNHVKFIVFYPILAKLNNIRIVFGSEFSHNFGLFFAQIERLFGDFHGIIGSVYFVDTSINYAEITFPDFLLQFIVLGATIFIGILLRNGLMKSFGVDFFGVGAGKTLDCGMFAIGRGQIPLI